MINILIKKAQMGCTESRNKIVEQHTHIAKKVAMRYVGVTNDISDIQQEGVLGLFQAIDAYEDSHDCSFETYATRRVFTVIDEYVLKNKHIHSTPLYLLKKLRSMKNRMESDADERHYDNKLNITDFNGGEVSIVNEGESGGITEEYLSAWASEGRCSDADKHDVIERVRQVLQEKEGGKFLLLNTLSGESIKSIAKTYEREPYYINKKIKECLTEFGFSET